MSAVALPFETLTHLPRPAATARGGPDGFVLLSAAEIFAPQPQQAFLVEGLLRRGSVVVLGGLASSGKTWLAVQLLICVATGTPWLGFDCERGRGAFLDWENGRQEFSRRAKKVARGLGIDSLADLGVAVAIFPRPRMGGPEFMQHIRAVAKDHDVIVIDSLRAATRGSDENASSIREGLDQLREVAEETGCTFLVLAHARKSSSSGAATDGREVLRGSIAIVDAADSVLVVRRHENAPTRISHVKNRHGAEVHDFGVRIEDVDDGEAVLLTRVHLESEQAGGAQAPPRNSVLDVVASTPGINSTKLRERIGGRGVAVDDEVKQLERDGMVENRGTPARPKWYAVAPTPDTDHPGAESCPVPQTPGLLAGHLPLLDAGDPAASADD